MRLVPAGTEPIDVTTTPLHLGRGSRAFAVEGFGWDPETLAAYSDAVRDDGDEGRMVMVFDSTESWTSWERHPAGDEVVLCLSGRLTLIQETDEGETRIELRPNQAAINDRGLWHTADVHEPGRFLTVTAGMGTEHRPR